jgi:4-amino-4-deoxy-L-arabinose transferase-like glycosyltransferase
LLGFLVRLAAASAAGLATPRFGDWDAFVSGARSIASTGAYPDRTTYFFFEAPGYPFYLAAATLGHPESIARDKIASAAAGAAAAPLLAWISLALFGSRRIALATGIAGALLPSFVLFSSDVQSESLFLPLLLAAAALLLAAADRSAVGLALAAGGCLAAAALTRPSALALAPLLLAPLADRRSPPRARRRLALAAAAGFAAALAPWTIRNALHFGELLPVSDGLGATFFDGNSVWANRIYALEDRRDVAPMNAAMHADRVARLAALGIVPGTEAFRSPSRRSWALILAALEDRRADPAGTRLLLARKIWHWLRPYPTPFWGWPIVLSATLFYLALYAAAAAGMATAVRRGTVWFSLAVLAISMAVHLAILVLWRYRVPYWDPILLLYSVPAAGRWLAGRATGRSLA